MTQWVSLKYAINLNKLVVWVWSNSFSAFFFAFDLPHNTEAPALA